MGLVSDLFKLARAADDVQTVASGDPKKIARRGKNILLGRMLAKAGIWRRLWK